MGKRKRGRRRADDSPAPTRHVLGLADTHLPARLRRATDAVELSISEEDVTIRLPTEKVVRGALKLGRVAIVLISAFAGWLLGARKSIADTRSERPQSCEVAKAVAEDPG